MKVPDLLVDKEKKKVDVKEKKLDLNIKPIAKPISFPNFLAIFISIKTIIAKFNAGTNNNNKNHHGIFKNCNLTYTLYIGIKDAQPGLPAFTYIFQV